MFCLGLAGCRTAAPGAALRRQGDEIVVAGQLFHTGTRVVTWMDPGGYDAYRVERRFSPLAESGWEKTKASAKDIATPNRYGLRQDALGVRPLDRSPGERAVVEAAVAQLQTVVDHERPGVTLAELDLVELPLAALDSMQHDLLEDPHEARHDASSRPA